MKFSDIPQFTKDGQWECNYSLKSGLRKIEEWQKEDNLQLNPDFQRGHVWTEEQQIAFMEFFLKGGKTARVIYFNHPGWNRDWEGDMVLVDGLQRITAIKRFIDNEIKVFGYYFKEFEGSPNLLQDIKFNINNLKTRKEVLQWYIDFNSGGTIHTNDELDKVRELLKQEG